MCLYVTVCEITEVIPKISFPPYIPIRNHGIHSLTEFRASTCRHEGPYLGETNLGNSPFSRSEPDIAAI